MTRSTTLRLSWAAFMTVALALPAFAAGEWIDIFNGKDLTGWKPRGGAKWTVEDGCLVGQQNNGKVGDFYTEKQYDNFELRAKYKMNWPANSGIWFRTNAANSRGYQYDILKYTNPIAFSGTLYCPGKMFITRNLDESLEKKDGWNDARIWANGDHLILWLNGTKTGECHDKTCTAGSIGIQVHGGDQFKNMKITLKDMKLRTLQPGDKPAEK